MTLYKITGPAGEPLHGGNGNWHLPKGKRPGKWMPVVDDVRACRRGYHLIRARAITEWLPPAGQSGFLWEAEGRGQSDTDGDKVAFARARLIRCVGVLDEVSMRLAAADMAERVLPIFRAERPNDGRPAAAIQAVRDFARGNARYAAWDAARAADAAARYAAWDAARAAANGAARDAANGAARDAANGAARDAAWDAAWAAAWDAASAAAWDANGAAIIAQAEARLRELG